MAFIILATLLSKGRRHNEKEVVDLTWKERGTQIGVFLSAFSVVFFASGNWQTGFLFLGLGIIVSALGSQRKGRAASPRAWTS